MQSIGILDITGNKSVSDKVLGRSLCEEDVGFVEEKNAAPSVGETEVAL